MSYPETQEKSGHLHGKSVNSAKKSGDVPDGQQHSGYTEPAGEVNASRSSGGAQVEGQDERGYTKDGTDSRSTARANDGVGSGFKRI